MVTQEESATVRLRGMGTGVMGTILRFCFVDRSLLSTFYISDVKRDVKNGNSLAWLRNAGSHSAESYCTVSEGGRRLPEKRVDRRGLGAETGASGVRKVSAASNCDNIR